MAQYHAIAAVGSTIVALLRDHCPSDLAKGSEFQLYAPANFAAPMDQGLSLMLYRISTQMFSDKGYSAQSRPLELQYLLTAWAPSVEMQHHLLGYSISCIRDNPKISPETLNKYAPQFDFRNSDQHVQVLDESMDIAESDRLTIGDTLKTKVPVSMSIRVTNILLDSMSTDSDKLSIPVSIYTKSKIE